MSQERATATGVEQRAAIRFSSCSKTSCHIVSSKGASVWDAKVHDLSTDGIGLILQERLEPGTLIALDLENSLKTRVRTLAARVVHAKPEGQGGWLVGCTFVRGLEEREIDLFSASADGRAWVRTCCDLNASVRSTGNQKGGPWLARVINISLGGIGLLSSRPIDKGALLDVTLASPQNGGALTFVARVVQRGVQVDKEWPLGCEFLEQLSQEDVNTLLM